MYKKTKIISSIILLLYTSLSYSGYLVKIPLEHSSGGNLPDEAIQFSEKKSTIDSFSFIGTELLNNNGYSTSLSYTYGFNFSASNFEKLYIVDESGNKTDVSSVKTYKWTVSIPNRNKSYHLEATNKGKIVKSAELTTSQIYWCNYATNNTLWLSNANSLTLTHIPDGIYSVAVPNDANAFYYTKNGWYYTTHTLESKQWYNDQYYIVCKTGTAIANTPLETRAQCQTYEANKYGIITSGNNKRFMWKDGTTTIDTTITTQSSSLLYTINGYEYYNAGYDTNDNLYDICRQKAH